eukprot:SAG11_NODE_1097_length_5882_cov_3.116376_6_plen_154_part_00
MIQEGAHALHAVERNSDDVSSIELVSTEQYGRMTRKRIWLIPTWDTCTGPMLAELFTKHIIFENGAPAEIISDRDVRFAHGLGFWQSFHSVYHGVVWPRSPKLIRSWPSLMDEMKPLRHHWTTRSYGSETQRGLGRDITMRSAPPNCPPRSLL